MKLGELPHDTALGESMHFSYKSFRLGKGWRRDGDNLKGVDFQKFSDDDSQTNLACRSPPFFRLDAEALADCR